MPSKSNEAQRRYNKTWYDNNKTKRREYNDAARQAIRDHILAIKLRSKCKECGESHPATLDFHHRDPSQKEFEVSVAYRKGYSITKIDAEIAKCDIICANCHRKLHWGA